MQAVFTRPGKGYNSAALIVVIVVPLDKRSGGTPPRIQRPVQSAHPQHRADISRVPAVSLGRALKMHRSLSVSLSVHTVFLSCGLRNGNLSYVTSR